MNQQPETSLSREQICERSFAILIGINRFEKFEDTESIERYELKCAVNDATELKKVLRQHGWFKDENIHLLTDDKATLRGVFNAFAKIKKSVKQLRGKNSNEFIRFLFYAATHAENDYSRESKKEPILILYDTRDSMLSKSGLDSLFLQRQIDEIAAHQSIVIFDCCFAGGLGFRSQEGAQQREIPDQIPRAQMAKGQAVFYACAADQLAFEPSEPNECGYFMQALLKGINEMPAGPDGIIAADQLGAYLNRAVPALVKEKRNTPQQPGFSFKQDTSGVLAVAFRFDDGKLAQPIPLSRLAGTRRFPWRLPPRRTAGVALGLASVLGAGTALWNVRRDHLADAAIETGWKALKYDHPLDALRHFNRALQSGSKAADLPFLISRAARSVDAIVMHLSPRSIEYAAYSPDNQRIVTVGNNNLVVLWNASRKEPPVVLAGHRGDVLHAVFSPDGTRLVTGSKDRTAIVWDVREGAHLLHRLAGGDQSLVLMAWNPDGTRLVTNRGIDKLCIWDAVSGRELLVVEADLTGHTTLSFSRDGRVLWAAGMRKTVARSWDLQTGMPKQAPFGNESDTISYAQLSADKRFACSISNKGDLVLWNTETGTATKIARDDKIARLTFSADGRRILAVRSDSSVLLMNAQEAGSPDWSSLKLSGSQEKIVSAEFSPDGKEVVVASSDGLVRVYDASIGAEIGLSEVAQFLKGATWNSDGSRILVYDSSDVWIFDAARRPLLATWPAKGRHAPLALFNQAGDRMLVTYPDGADVLETATGKRRCRIPFPAGAESPAATAAAFSVGANRFLIIGDERGHAAVWNYEYCSQSHDLVGHKDAIRHIEYIKDGSHILTQDAQSVRLWEVGSSNAKKVLSRDGTAITSAGFSPDANYFVIVYADQAAYVYDTFRPEQGYQLTMRTAGTFAAEKAAWSPDSARLLTFGGNSYQTWRTGDFKLREEVPLIDPRREVNPFVTIQDAAFSQDGRRILLATSHKKVELFEEGESTPALQTDELSEQQNFIALSPDGRFVSACVGKPCKDSSVRVWSGSSGLMLDSLDAHTNAVRTLAWNRLGDRLITVDAEMTVRLWSVGPDTRSAKELDVWVRCWASDQNLSVNPDDPYQVHKPACRNVLNPPLPPRWDSALRMLVAAEVSIEQGDLARAGFQVKHAEDAFRLLDSTENWPKRLRDVKGALAIAGLQRDTEKPGRAADEPATPVHPAMIQIPGGTTFLMGSAAKNNRHEVTLTRSFWLSETEVTQGNYKALMRGDNPSHFKSQQGADRLPVETVTWFEALEFCNELSRCEGKKPCYEIKNHQVTWTQGLDCEGYRLPTEAEWEFAARAGQNFGYAGMDDAERVGVFNRDMGTGSTDPVRLRNPNGFRLYDMSGNVWEWTWDSYDRLVESPQIDPLGPRDGGPISRRAVRGGSWLTASTLAGLDQDRRGEDASARAQTNGIRLARTHIPEAAADLASKGAARCIQHLADKK